MTGSEAMGVRAVRARAVCQQPYRKRPGRSALSGVVCWEAR